MKIRTQLVVTLLLLSILPLSLLVAFNYTSSIRALRRAVETESAEVADDMELRMAAVGGCPMTGGSRSGTGAWRSSI